MMSPAGPVHSGAAGWCAITREVVFVPHLLALLAPESQHFQLQARQVQSVSAGNRRRSPIVIPEVVNVVDDYLKPFGGQR